MANLRMPRINSVVLSARLTRDVELRYTQGGTPVAKLSLAFDRAFKDSSGEWQNEASFLDATVWSKRAEQCAHDLHKGSPVIVEGYIKTRSYVDRDNNNRKVTEIVANRVHFLEKVDFVEQDEFDSAHTQEVPKNNSNLNTTTTDDDVPF